MTKEQVDKIISDQKNLNDLPNTELVNQMDLLTQEHERLKDIIVANTIYLDKLEEVYNNILKVYQQRNNGK